MARDPNNAVIVPKKKNEMKDEDLSEEDLALKKQLELYVERIQDSDADLQEAALQSMRQEILASTSSMTSVPKPLKFLRPHYATLKAYYDRMADSDLKYLLADVLSVLAMTMSAEGERESLKYRLLGSEGDIVSWGHEYVRNLAGEIVEEYMKRQSEDLSVDDLMELVEQIVAFLMEHNAEFEAVDLLMQVEDLYLVLEHVDSTNYKRTCLYLLSADRYIPDTDGVPVLDVVFAIYLKFEEYPSALQIALFLDNLQYVYQIFTTCDDLLLKKQFCYILGQHDKLMTVPSEASSGGSSGNWVFKNKEHVKASAAASLGMILLWDVDSGLAQIDKYFHSDDKNVIAGALLGVGILTCGVEHECDPALRLLADYVDKEDSSIKIGAIMGLGLAYAGAQCPQIRSKLSRVLEDKKMPLDVIVFTAISLGLVYVGSCDEDVSRTIISALRHRSVSELGQPLTRLLPLGLGLLYLGKLEMVEATLQISKTLNMKIRKHCYMTVFSCAYAGTGDVLKVQYLLGQCAQHLKRGETHQGPAVLGIAMVAMAEELGLEMAIRSLEHLLQYGEQNIRKAVPLALGLLCISDPKVNVMDTLSRLSHDTDIEVAMAAVISLGLIGSGTNNARIAGMLLNLSSYYYKEPRLLFCVRIAQGLVHLGKGLLTLAPYHSERFLLSPTAMAGILTMLHACLDMKFTIMGRYPVILYFLALAMQPRMLMTVDENLKPLAVPVRVGKAVDVVGQAGRPKTITGFQTHLTPVLLAAGDRAELATEKYIPLSPFLEGFVILKENPEYCEDH
ncbi:26S proteasome non-ATPase regulatory subunit 2 homolog A-like isoform X2 [Camellia sinensis]|uniref:26S proteasome non-ATPase regulatory subunit 2 homolog A-like isoform X2 n=1 Tax=Camellia sinensis TaxID=4442 RepID=UPI001035E8B0|nr:26S proteasome non-ATPase regulatory subunit 2 homolog A-like isoform X2 [Camellia sinensis]